MPTYYIDLDNGNDAADGSTFSLGGLPTVGPWKTITNGATAARIVAGDEIRISKTPDPVSIGNATWTQNSATVTISSSLTKTIDTAVGATWTVSANITGNGHSVRKYGATAQRFVVAAGFTTGKIAYKAVGGTQDFSSYEKICFWIYSTVAIAAGVLELRLCSDATGNVTVNTLPIPAVPIVNQHQAITWDNNAALGSSIQSVSLWALSDPGTPSITINNIFATNSLTLSGVIGYGNNIAYTKWYPIQSIVGTALVLDSRNTSDTGTPYREPTQTLTSYARETYNIGAAGSSTQALITINDNGSSGNYIHFSGGWNTSSVVKDGQTCFTASNFSGYMFTLNTRSYIKLSNIGVNQSSRAIILTGVNSFITFEKFWTASTDRTLHSDTSGTRSVTFIDCSFINAAELCININTTSYGVNWQFIRCNFFTSIGYGIKYGTSVVNHVSHLTDCVFRNNSSASVLLGCGPLYARNCLFADTTEIEFQYVEGVAYSVHHDQTEGNNKVLGLGYNITWQTVEKQGSDPGAWAIQTTNNTRIATLPIKFKIAEILAQSGLQLTIQVWIKKLNASNSYSKIILYQDGLLGNGADIQSVKADNTNWEQLQVQITPIITGVVPVYLETYYTAGNDTIYIGSIITTQ